MNNFALDEVSWMVSPYHEKVAGMWWGCVELYKSVCGGVVLKAFISEELRFAKFCEILIKLTSPTRTLIQTSLLYY